MGRTLLKILVFLFAFVFLCVAPPLGAALFYFLAFIPSTSTERTHDDRT